jgi:hypothetical protein
MMLTCDECSHKFEPTDMLYTTFGTAHADQNIDYCAPCVEAKTAGSPRPPLVMMTAAARAGINVVQKPTNPARGVQKQPPDSLGGNAVL